MKALATKSFALHTLLAVSLCGPALLAGCSRGKSAGAPAAIQSNAPEKSELLHPGDVAPDFSGIAHTGEKVSLSALRGKAVVLYFYPKDGTPGCSVEADAFKAESGGFERSRAVVLGVSSDDAESHQDFAREHGLPFLLLPDTDHVIAKIYGVGSVFGMMSRVTYLIGPDGVVRKVYPNVSPEGHAKEVLADLEALGATPR